TYLYAFFNSCWVSVQTRTLQACAHIKFRHSSYLPLSLTPCSSSLPFWLFTLRNGKHQRSTIGPVATIGEGIHDKFLKQPLTINLGHNRGIMFANMSQNINIDVSQQTAFFYLLHLVVTLCAPHFSVFRACGISPSIV